MKKDRFSLVFLLPLLLTITIPLQNYGPASRATFGPSPSETSQDNASTPQKKNTSTEDRLHPAYQLFQKYRKESLQKLRKRYRSLNDVPDPLGKNVRRLVKQLGSKSYQKRDRVKTQLLQLVRKNPVRLLPLLKNHLDRSENPEIRAKISYIQAQTRRFQLNKPLVQKLMGLLCAFAERKKTPAAVKFLKRMQETYPNSTVDHMISRLMIVPGKPEAIQRHLPPYSGPDPNYREFQLDMVVDHCRREDLPPEHLDDWPEEKRSFSAYKINVNRKISTPYQFRTRLLNRPEHLKKRHPVRVIVKHKGWFIATRGTEGKTKVISTAYAIKKNTRTIYYWFNW